MDHRCPYLSKVSQFTIGYDTTQVLKEIVLVMRYNLTADGVNDRVADEKLLYWNTMLKRK